MTTNVPAPGAPDLVPPPPDHPELDFTPPE